MNVENNGQHVNDDDDVNLTAYALGEINDPKLKSRLELLLKEDESKRADYEATLQLAAMIRESVDDDLPLAPGSLHQVVLAELEESPSIMSGGLADDGLLDGKADAPIASALNSEVKSNGKHVGRSSKSGSLPKPGSLPRTAYSYRVQAIAITLCLMVVCTFAIWRPWESKTGERVNVAVGHPDASDRQVDRSQESATDEMEAGDVVASELEQLGQNALRGSSRFGRDGSQATDLETNMTTNRSGTNGRDSIEFSPAKSANRSAGRLVEGSVDQVESFNYKQSNIDQSVAGQPGAGQPSEKMERKNGAYLVPRVRKMQSAQNSPSQNSTSQNASGQSNGSSGIVSGASLPGSIRRSSAMPDSKAPRGRKADSKRLADKVDGDSPFSGGSASRGMSEKKTGGQKAGEQEALDGSGGFGASGGGSGFAGGLGGGGGGLGASEENASKKFAERSDNSPLGGMKDKELDGSVEKDRLARKQSKSISGIATGDEGIGIDPRRNAAANPSADELKLRESTKPAGERLADPVQPKANSAQGNLGMSKKPVSGVDSGGRGGRDFGSSKPSKEDSAEKAVDGKIDRSFKSDASRLKPSQSKPSEKKSEVDGTLEAKKKKHTTESFAKELKPSSAKSSSAKSEPGITEARIADPAKAQKMVSGRANESAGEAKAASRTDTSSTKSNESPAPDREGKSILEELEKMQESQEMEESAQLLSQDEPLVEIHENDFVKPLGTDALSTFSIDTDTASYTNLRQKLQSNVRPNPAEVRIEEMLNYFDYSYPQPKETDPFSVSMEIASCPWKPGNKLLRVGLKAREIANEKRPPSNLVFLVDVSGSMRNEKKLPLLQQGLNSLVDQLREDDYVSIVTYSDTIQNPLQPTDGSKKAEIKKVINSLTAGGSTNGSGGLEESYRLAEKYFLKGGTNRIVMGTDGDFNFGISDDDELVKFIKTKTEQSKVYLTVCGFGIDNFKDQKVQKMAQNGNGKVFYIDSVKEAERVFVEKVSGGLVTAAKDVKLQLLFNPRTVKEYRLIGYENRMLEAQDFEDAQKDAGEMDAGDRVTALYEFVPSNSEFTFPVVTEPRSDDLKYQMIEKKKYSLTKVANSNEIATLRVRFKQPESDKGEDREFPVINNSTSFNRASKDFQFASSVAGLGLLLRKSKHRGSLNFEGLEEFATGALNNEKDESRKEFLDLIRRAKKLYQ